MAMRMMLIGKGGQVGFELQRALAPLGEVMAVDYPDCDLADAASIRSTIAAARPQVIVNAGAYTAVDKAETEPQRVQAINGLAPGVIGAAASAIGARVIHYSTDYVFDGTKSRAYLESDHTNPLGVYGATKRAGEEALAASGARHFTFRTSWVFGAHGGNFVKTILRLAAERDGLNVVADQIGAPTSAALIADVTAQVLGQLAYRPDGDMPSGIYHLVAAGETSWHGFAQAIVAGALARGHSLRLGPEAIRRIATSEYPLPARRPANSRLDTSRLQQTFGLVMPPWQSGLDHVLTQIL
jgi:dTDP-4-dehydrorhamnose reductase